MIRRRLAITSAFIALCTLPVLSHWRSSATFFSESPSPEASKGLGVAKQPPVAETRESRAIAPGYLDVIQRTQSMISNGNAQRLADRHGLDIVDVTWEDTGRFKGSAVGPNISDMTIQVQHKTAEDQYSLHLMPVIRFPNFSDKTADIPLNQLYLTVGNEKNKTLRKVPLRDVLGNLRQYLSKPTSWKGKQKSLLAERDSHVLTSAQAAFLPIPKGGIAEFNPVIFNYQSRQGDPAVLTLLATREGTSVTVIDNQRDGFDAGRTWGQRLFFNKNGERASFTGKRLSDFKREGDAKQVDDGSDRTPISLSHDDGLNMVMLIQVPLKQKSPGFGLFEDSVALEAAPAPTLSKQQRSNVEAAVIGHGKVEGPFTEIDNLEIERDPRFPIRVTVQFYKGTNNGVVSESDLSAINDQLEKVYSDADYIGSLVTEGDTRRPTEHFGPKHEPPGWWDDFWQRHEANTGQSKRQTIQMLRKLRGKKWYPITIPELERELRKLPKG